MARRTKAAPEDKIAAVEAYLRGELGPTEIMQKFIISKKTWQTWLMLYKTRGPEGLISQPTNKKYSAELKERVVQEYLAGKNSLFGLCAKYSISRHSMVQAWIKRYNGQKGFGNPNSRSGIYMTKGRKTTQEERVEIVSHCVANGKDYGATIEKYQVSYQQIYSWVKKYEEGGVDRLNDKRGKRKPDEEMSEVERLKAEIKLLQAENKHKEMVIDILKKVKEVERRRG